MEKAVICVEEALKAAQAMMKPGVKELKWQLCWRVQFKNSGAAVAGSVISGERGCLPHAITSEKNCRRGNRDPGTLWPSNRATQPILHELLPLVPCQRK
jgi:Xaa-Pro aminopeptidase